MDPILAAFLIAVLVVMAVSGVAKHRAEQRALASRPAEAVCSCDHGYGLHTEAGCQFVRYERVKVRDNSRYEDNGFGEEMLVQADIEWAMVDKPCRCRRYTGPVPLDTIWTPPMIGGV